MILALSLDNTVKIPLPFPSQRYLKKQLKQMLSALAYYIPDHVPQHMRFYFRFVDEETSCTLNNRYRGKDYSTNILTFTYPSADHVLSADFVICTNILLQEARQQNKTVKAHAYHLMVHGILHAFGYDHESSDEDADHMENIERFLLSLIGISNPYAPEAVSI